MLQTSSPVHRTHVQDVSQDQWIIDHCPLQDDAFILNHQRNLLVDTTPETESNSSSRPAQVPSRRIAATNQPDSPSWTVIETEESEPESERDESQINLETPPPKGAASKVRRIRGAQSLRVPLAPSGSSKSSISTTSKTSWHVPTISAMHTEPGPRVQRLQASSSGHTTPNAVLHPSESSAKQRGEARREIFDGVVITVPVPWKASNTGTGNAHVEHRKQYDTPSGPHGNTPSVQYESLGQHHDLRSALASAFSLNNIVHRDIHGASSTDNERELSTAHESRPPTGDRAYANANVPDLHTFRPPPPNNVRAVSDYWQIVDKLLETEVAPSAVLHRYAEPRVSKTYGLSRQNMRFAVPKGKGKAAIKEVDTWKAYTMPRWSRIAAFKERLDSRLGPGDMNRGLSKRPKPKRGAGQDSGTPGLSDTSASAVRKRSRSTGPEISGSMTEASDTAALEDVRDTKRRKVRHESDPQ